jgi:hypothetical protein
MLSFMIIFNFQMKINLNIFLGHGFKSYNIFNSKNSRDYNNLHMLTYALLEINY